MCVSASKREWKKQIWLVLASFKSELIRKTDKSNSVSDGLSAVVVSWNNKEKVVEVVEYEFSGRNSKLEQKLNERFFLRELFSSS